MKNLQKSKDTKKNLAKLRTKYAIEKEKAKKNY